MKNKLFLLSLIIFSSLVAYKPSRKKTVHIHHIGWMTLSEKAVQEASNGRDFKKMSDGCVCIRHRVYEKGPDDLWHFLRMLGE